MSAGSGSPSPPQLNPPLESTPPVSPLNLSNSDSFPSPRLGLDPIIEHVKADHIRPDLVHRPRTGSVGSISFRLNGNAAPSGQAKSKAASRLRKQSPPPPARFQHHVSFDNFTGGDATEKNTVALTINDKHKGYQFRRRSRIFMVGIDENDYSDIALQWMLEELVDDGDEIICIRVVDKDSKVVSDRALEKKQYLNEAKALMKRIQAKNDDNRAISIVLEFAVGKVQTTFQKMIQLYEPAMLVVGTRGRSLGGLQGLMSNRTSFSKWCLQYSPVPVVVVRPTEKRLKKKQKRDGDPARQEYARILKESGVEQHETAAGSNAREFEESNTAADEAHAVAVALGLPAELDPSLQQKLQHLEGSRSLTKVDSAKTDASGSQSPDESRPASPQVVIKNPKSRMESPIISPIPSGDEDGEDDGEEGSSDEEGEFEAVPGHTLIGNDTDLPEIEKKIKLHQMEMNEAQALTKNRHDSVGSADSSTSLPGGGSVPPVAVADADVGLGEDVVPKADGGIVIGGVGPGPGILSTWSSGIDDDGEFIIKTRDDAEWKA